MSEFNSPSKSAFFSRRHKKLEKEHQIAQMRRSAHEKLSSLIKNIFYLYIFANLFCLVTLFTTSDSYLIENSGLLRIPILAIPVPYQFFVASSAMFLIAIFVYLSIRFEELDTLNNVEAQHKLPYIFNSQQKAAIQLSNFLLYFLGPICLFAITEKSYIFKELDRLSAIFVFFILLSFMSYKKRSERHFLLGTLVFLSLGGFIYLVTSPYPFHLTHSSVDMAGRDLKRVEMNAYRLKNAVFNHTQLFEAQIRHTDFFDSQLWGANFNRASIYHSRFVNCDIEYANFGKTILRDIDFLGAKLKQANFSDTVLFNLRFGSYLPPRDKDGRIQAETQTNLSYAKFNNAKLVALNFDGANLNHAEFSNSDIQEGSFIGANLNYVDFQTTTGLTCEQLQQGKSFRLIELPYYLRNCQLPPLKESTVSKLDIKSNKRKKQNKGQK